MLNLNPFAISNLFIIITLLPLSTLILSHAKHSAPRLYSLLCFCVLIWGIGAFTGSTTKDPAIADLFLKFGYCGVLFIPPLYLHAISKITNYGPTYLLTLSYIQAFYFLYLNLTSRLFTLSWQFDSFYYYSGGTTFLASFFLWLIFATICQATLITYFKKKFGESSKELMFILSGTIAFLGGISNFLPVFNINLYPYGNFLVPPSFFLIAYIIFKHNFLGIEFVIKRSIVYTVLLAIVSICYLIIVVILERLAQGYLGYNSITFTILIAFIFGILVIPLRNRIQYLVDKIFFEKSPIEIEEENKRLREEIIQSEKLKTIATLASGVAHEIKNPLTAINTFTEQLPQRLNDKEFLKKFSKIVGGEARRINDLVHELLDFAKPSPPQLKPASIYTLLDETLELMSSAFLKYGIKVVRNYGTTKSLILVIDPQQIRQALMNIYINAIEAMPQGGTLTVASRISGSEDLGIEVNKNHSNPQTLKSQNPILAISIKDTGAGIPAKDIPHIFDPFFTTKDHGTGLGLAVTHGIIEKHSGRIYAKSETNTGTEFVIELPINNDKNRSSEDRNNR